MTDDAHAEWDLVPNPRWNDHTPRPLGKAACHDGSHFITVQCSCGEQMHLHESALSQVPHGSRVRSRCKGCGDTLTFQPGVFFAELRRQGWIADV